MASDNDKPIMEDFVSSQENNKNNKKDNQKKSTPWNKQTSQARNKNPWAFKEMINEINDFASTFLPTDDIYGSSGSGGDDVPALAHFQWLAEKRIGVATKITRKPAEDAIRNRFKIMSHKNEIIEREDIMDFCERTDFYNQLAKALYFERVYGASFLMKYYTNEDKTKQDFNEPAPVGQEPVAFQAFPPTYMSPVETHKTFYLDSDPQKWDIQGGNYNSQRIHHTRIHVLITRKVPHRWRGLSVFEPIWIPLMSYFQAQIYLLRAFAKLGNTIPYWLIDTNEDISDLYDDRIEIIEEMKMNGIYIGKKGDEFGFAPTNIAAGMTEMMEIWKEDIAAGTSFPVPIIFGRVTSAGLGGAAYLMAERYYWNEIGNIQASISDDVLRIFRDSGFKGLEKKRIDWNLAITKTDQQRLLDEGMEIENEMMREQLIQTRMLTDQMARGEVDASGNPIEEEGEGDTKTKPKSDFILQHQDTMKRYYDAIKLRRLDLLKRNPNV